MVTDLVEQAQAPMTFGHQALLIGSTFHTRMDDPCRNELRLLKCQLVRLTCHALCCCAVVDLLHHLPPWCWHHLLYHLLYHLQYYACLQPAYDIMQGLQASQHIAASAAPSACQTAPTDWGNNICNTMPRRWFILYTKCHGHVHLRACKAGTSKCSRVWRQACGGCLQGCCLPGAARWLSPTCTTAQRATEHTDCQDIRDGAVGPLLVRT